MGGLWGIGGFRGGGKKSQTDHMVIIKNNPTKISKIGEIGKNLNFYDLFLLEMVYLALEAPLKWDLFRLMDCEKNHYYIYFSSAFLHTLSEYLLHFWRNEN